MGLYTPEKVNCNGEIFKVFIDVDTIDKRIDEIGHQIDEDYKDKNPIFIGVLNGSFIFLSDLMKRVSIDCEMDFIKLSSYGDKKVSSGEVTEKKHLDANIEGRHIILVEDIVDTGLSLSYLVKKLRGYNPASIAIASFLHKKEATRFDVEIDYLGFEIPNKFVLGYGLDYAQKGRNLAQVYILE